MGGSKQDGGSGSGRDGKDSSSARRRSSKWDQKPLHGGQEPRPRRTAEEAGLPLTRTGQINERRSSEADVRPGLLETDGVPHRRRSQLSRVVDGAPHKTRHRTTVGGELGPHRRQTGADGGHHRLVVSCFIIVSRAGEWAKLTGDTTDIERRWRRMGPSRHGRWTGWGITEG